MGRALRGIPLYLLPGLHVFPRARRLQGRHQQPRRHLRYLAAVLTGAADREPPPTNWDVGPVAVVPLVSRLGALAAGAVTSLSSRSPAPDFRSGHEKEESPMRWRNMRESDNVEDRQGQSP